jgi:uncharacterized protein VirK/YbjX
MLVAAEILAMCGALQILITDNVRSLMPTFLRLNTTAVLDIAKYILEEYTRLPLTHPKFVARVKIITKSLVALIHIIIIIASTYIRSSKAQSNTIALLKYYPNLLNRDLYSGYLAKIFDDSITTRYCIFMSHCMYITARVKKTFFKEIFYGSILLWDHIIDDKNLNISLIFERTFRREGDLSLVFQLNRVTIYLLSFTVVPGYSLGVTAPQVLFVSRVQGTKERFEDIRIATKLCNDIAPPYLLVTATQAIAFDMDIDFVAGVGGGEQLSSDEDGGFPFDYDAFWKSCTGIEADRNFYLFSASFAGKPIDQISPVHRRRTRIKRQFKNQINKRIVCAFAEKCLKSGRPPLHANPMRDGPAAHAGPN